LTLKDNIPVAGMPATWGSCVFADYRPQRDETPRRRLREAGAIVFAKTNAPEFTLQNYTSNDLFGTTRNPWDSRLTPGGSSGGAVACVAAGIGPLAIATDGGPSIRRPASHAGVVGLKPTAGRVPRRDGFPPILLDFEVIGPIARTVPDIVVTTALMSRADPEVVAQASLAPFSLTFTSPPERRRALFVPTFADAPVDPEIAASVAAAASNLARLSHEVTESRSFDLADEINVKWSAVAQTGVAWLMREHSDKRDLLGASIRAMADAGNAVPATDFFDGMHAAHVLRGRLAEFFTSYDMILTPPRLRFHGLRRSPTPTPSRASRWGRAARGSSPASSMPPGSRRSRYPAHRPTRGYPSASNSSRRGAGTTISAPSEHSPRRLFLGPKFRTAAARRNHDAHSPPQSQHQR
jgi:aspartyl-tRNA(Asn)/glutamyl-tRNA(Gln) amidotransferase subunit A